MEVDSAVEKSPSCITGISPVGLNEAQFRGGMNGITAASSV
jgi:hypothetical protein